MDPQRVRSISTGLMRLGRSLGEVGAEGTSCIGELQQVWAGPDLESFVTTWHASARSIDDASVSMCRFADILVAQAGQQEDTSAGAGGGPGGGARGGRNGGPRGGNPDITDGQKNGSQYEKINGPIDDGDITADDVSQGALGDCWFISSMMGVANANPELLRDNIKDNGDGTYDVTLYDDGKPVVVRVSGDFPANQGDPTYADNNGGNRELWAPAVREGGRAALRRQLRGPRWRLALEGYRGHHGPRGRDLRRQSLDSVRGQGPTAFQRAASAPSGRRRHRRVHQRGRGKVLGRRARVEPRLRGDGHR